MCTPLNITIRANRARIAVRRLLIFLRGRESGVTGSEAGLLMHEYIEKPEICA